MLSHRYISSPEVTLSALGFPACSSGAVVAQLQMACRGVAIFVCFMMVLWVGHAYPGGRKVLQSGRSSAYRGATTAALTETEANIQQAVAISEQPGTPAVQAANPRPRDPNPRPTDKGTASEGRPESKQASTQATIRRQASSGKVPLPSKPAAKSSDVPKQVAAMTAGAKTANTGRGTSQQAKTAAGIEDAIARQQAVAAVNAQPGPNIPSGSRP